MKVFCLFLLLSSTVKGTHIQITIPDGTLRGAVLTDYDNGTFYSFTRIPYARPPLGECRFNRAEKNKPWKGVLDATQPTPVCTQANQAKTALLGQEDCLYLNVFTKSTNKYASKPVMVYIHGGGFVEGSSADYGAEFLMTHDIVLVTINYRLGVYGFINTVNSEIANNGLKDQVLALKWVQSNIKYFGGDPKKVTLSGHSAGGISVHAHILSPLSVGLFHQAIIMSGSILMTFLPAANDTTTPVAKYLGLDTTNYDTMIQGLRNASNANLFEATKKLHWFENPTLGLVIEKPGSTSFLSDYPLKIITSGNYKQIPLVIGNTNREGLIVYSNKLPKHKHLISNIPDFFDNKNEVMNKVRTFYNLDSLDGPSNLIDFYSDIWFRYAIFRAAREHVKLANHKNTYYYQFSGDAKLNFEKPLLPSLKDFYGACHADELGFLFNSRGLPSAGSIEERLMRNMVKMWANFVRIGNPVKNLNTFQESVLNYVNITNSGLKIGVLNETSFGFWDEMYKNYSNGLY